MPSKPTDPHAAEICFARAADCERLAEEATTAGKKAILLDLARRWRDLAGDEAAVTPIGEAQRSPVERVDEKRPRPQK
jgi:hypothetical protein